MEIAKLKSLIINVEDNIFKLNGEDIGDTTTELHLDYENGEWSLQVTRDHTYTSNDQNAKG